MAVWLKVKSVLTACLLAGVLGGLYFSLPVPAYSQAIPTANGLANTAWPMYQHDPAHTGQSTLDGVASSPKQVWATNLGPGLNGGSRGGMSIGVDGNLYVSYGDHLFALNPVNGAIQWQLTKGSSFSTPTVAQDGTLYYGASDNLYAMDPSGQQKWWTNVQSVANLFTTFPILDADGNVYYTHFGLHSYTPEGTHRWDYDLTPYNTNPALDAAGNLYFSRPDAIHVVSRDGTLIKKLSLAMAGDPVIAPDGTVYATTYYAAVEAVNPQGEKWSFLPDESDPSRIDYTTPALGPDGTLYTATKVNYEPDEPFYLYAIRPDGSLRWKYTLPRSSTNPSGAGIPLVDNNGRIYVCAANGSCYAFSPTGALLWEYTTSYGKSSSLVISSDGTVIICGGDGVVRALSSGVETTQLVADTTRIWLMPNPAQPNLTVTVHLTSTSGPLTWSLVPNLPYWITAKQYSGTTPSDLQLLIDANMVAWNNLATLQIKANDLNSENGTVNILIGILNHQIYLPLAIQ